MAGNNLLFTSSVHLHQLIWTAALSVSQMPPPPTPLGAPAWTRSLLHGFPFMARLLFTLVILKCQISNNHGCRQSLEKPQHNRCFWKVKLHTHTHVYIYSFFFLNIKLQWNDVWCVYIDYYIQIIYISIYLQSRIPYKNVFLMTSKLILLRVYVGTGERMFHLRRLDIENHGVSSRGCLLCMLHHVAYCGNPWTWYCIRINKDISKQHIH